MNDKKRFALAARVRKKIQKQNPYFQIIKRRDEIDKELKKTGSHGYRTFCAKKQKER